MLHLPLLHVDKYVRTIIRKMDYLDIGAYSKPVLGVVEHFERNRSRASK